MFIDTHCHIHDSEFYLENREESYQKSLEAGVVAMICVGTNEKSSHEAVDFAASHPGCYAVVGVHPHDSKDGWSEVAAICAKKPEKLVGIGEIGLDYFYTHSSKQIQQEALQAQMQLALDYSLPVSFHVRDAFEDFWPIFDNFPSISGVLHSFTDSRQNAEKGLQRGLFIGINGISTFTKDASQQELYRDLPIDKIVLETDAPFLTPAPFRGTMNLPAHVGRVAEFQAVQRGLPLDDVAAITTASARQVFRLPT